MDDKECLCVGSIIDHSLNTTEIHEESLAKILNCRDFISNTGSLAFKASEFMYRQGDHEMSKEFLLNSVLNGVEKNLVYDYNFVKNFLEAHPNFKVEIDKSIKLFRENSFDQALYDQIDLYYRLDQDIRTKGVVVINNVEETDMIKVDRYLESNIRSLFNSSSLSELEIGVTGTYKLGIILLHCLTHIDDNLFEHYDAKLRSSLCEGRFNPIYYATIIDRRRQYNASIDPLYYEFNLDKLQSDNPRYVDSIRYSIGLSPLYNDDTFINDLFELPCTICL